MHFGDSIFIFLLALVLFGPKKLPEIGRTIGKLLAEFRRASNEFKFQIQEELRNMEEDERRKKLAEMQAQKAGEASAATETAPSTSPTILPPSTGTPVSTSAPYATPVAAEEAIVAPSAAEVVVEPSVPTETAAPAIDAAPETPAHLDLTAHGNGAHTAVTNAEPVESSVPSEPLHHG
jgi:sec-independent protein translocase protein TatB